MLLQLTYPEHFLVTKFDNDSWTQELVVYIVCLALAGYIGALTTGVLSLNTRPLTKETWRARNCRSVVAVVLFDLLAYDGFLFIFGLLVHKNDVRFVHELSRRVLKIDNVYSVPAAVFMTACALTLTVAVNVVYVRMFGCCACCCCSCCGHCLCRVCCCDSHVGDRLVEQSRTLELTR